jgi:Na+-driven multidrug efflux pump
MQQTGTLEPIHIWLAILAGHVTRFTLSYLRFAQGRWRGIRVDVGRSRETAAGEA